MQFRRQVDAAGGRTGRREAAGAFFGHGFSCLAPVDGDGICRLIARQDQVFAVDAEHAERFGEVPSVAVFIPQREIVITRAADKQTTVIVRQFQFRMLGDDLAVVAPQAAEHGGTDFMNRHPGVNHFYVFDAELFEVFGGQLRGVERVQGHAGEPAMQGSVHFQPDQRQVFRQVTEVERIITAHQHQRVAFPELIFVIEWFQVVVIAEKHPEPPVVFRRGELKALHGVGAITGLRIFVEKNDRHGPAIRIPGVLRLDVGAGAVAQFQNILFAKFLQTAAGGTRGQAELFSQLAQGGQSIPGGEGAAGDHRLDVTGQSGY